MLTAVALDPQPNNFSPGSLSPRSRFLPLGKGDSDRHKDNNGDLVRNELIAMVSTTKNFKDQIMICTKIKRHIFLMPFPVNFNVSNVLKKKVP